MIQQAYKYVSLSLWPRITLFELKITYKLKSSGWGLEKSELPWQTKCFIALDVFSIELLACQVSMICAANWPRQLCLHKWCNIGLSVWHHQSSHLHTSHIFQTWISPELMQVFANGKRCFHSFIEFYAIHLKILR